MGRAARQLGNWGLLRSKLGLIYTRLTLTPWTILCFVSAILTWTVLVSLQSVTLSINAEAADLTSIIVETAGLNQTFPIVQDGVLRICDALPEAEGANCFVADFNTRLTMHPEKLIATSTPLLSRSLRVNKVYDNDDDTLLGVSVDLGSQGVQAVSLDCVQSIIWLNDIFRDDKREDVVTLVFHFWLFALSVISIVNESIPHLGAALASHVLATGWAAYRVHCTNKLQETYNELVVNFSCTGWDILGDWWDKRIANATPILIFNVVFLVVMGIACFKLYKVYSHQSFGRVGASNDIQKALKLVLLLSVFLQLATFFVLASAAMWIDKIFNGMIHLVVKHSALYLTSFVVVATLQIPWGIIGWISVRRESRTLFLTYCVIAAILLVISTLMFSSELYRYIFSTWSFFATLTVTSYILTVATAGLGIVCWWFGWGKGLAHYLKVESALGDVGFTPELFSKDPDSEKAALSDGSSWVVSITLPPRAQLRSGEYEEDKYSRIAPSSRRVSSLRSGVSSLKGHRDSWKRF